MLTSVFQHYNGNLFQTEFQTKRIKKKKESRLLRKKNSRAGNLYFGDAYKFVSFSSKRKTSLLSLHHVALKKDTK